MTARWVTNACRSCVRFPVRAARFLWGQTVGTARNWLSIASMRRVTANTPDWVKDSVGKVTKHIPRAFGRSETGADQLVSVAVLSVAVIVSAAFSAGATLVVLVLLAPFAVMAALRMVPAVNDRYTNARSGASRTGTGSVTDRIKRGR